MSCVVLDSAPELDAIPSVPMASPTRATLPAPSGRFAQVTPRETLAARIARLEASFASLKHELDVQLRRTGEIQVLLDRAIAALRLK